MKEDYNKSIQLQCITCGNSDFEFNDDKSWIKCCCCDREYLGGYSELVELNQENIDREVNIMKEEVSIDLQNDITNIFKNAFKGNKYIKIK
jgi:hypothetical protein